MRVLVVDNYDSFTYNLVQYLGELGASPTVIRNDEMTALEAAALRPNLLLISPGPGRPENAGISVELLQTLGTEIPSLGVCLGHQAIVAAFDTAANPGVVAIDGQMYDRPHLKRAKKLLSRVPDKDPEEHSGGLLNRP